MGYLMVVLGPNRLRHHTHNDCPSMLHYHQDQRLDWFGGVRCDELHAAMAVMLMGMRIPHCHWIWSWLTIGLWSLVLEETLIVVLRRPISERSDAFRPDCIAALTLGRAGEA